MDVCPQLTLSVRGDGYPVQRYADACMECGACAANCPAGAVAVTAGVGCFAALLRETFLGAKAGSCG